MTRFTDAMWAEIRPIYEAILDLPFNRELAAGALSRERFIFYMVQDAHYLGAFARALATAAAKATTPEAQITFNSGFAFAQLRMSTKAERRRAPERRMLFSTRTSTSVMLSIRRVPTGSASTVTVA